MVKKLTIAVDADVYAGRPNVVDQDLAEGYVAMVADAVRETEAEEWAEAFASDVF